MTVAGVVRNGVVEPEALLSVADGTKVFITLPEIELATEVAAAPGGWHWEKSRSRLGMLKATEADEVERQRRMD